MHSAALPYKDTIKLFLSIKNVKEYFLKLSNLRLPLFFWNYLFVRDSKDFFKHKEKDFGSLLNGEQPPIEAKRL